MHTYQHRVSSTADVTETSVSYELQYLTTAQKAQARENIGVGVATEITVANEASDTTCFPLFVTAATGDLGPKTNAELSFNSSNGELTAAFLTSIGEIAAGGIVTNATTGVGGQFQNDSAANPALKVVNSDDTNVGGLIEARAYDDVVKFSVSNSGAITATSISIGGGAITSTGTSGITFAAPSTGSPITYTLPSAAATLATLGANTFTGTQTVPAGSTTAPSLTFTGATNTGLSSPNGQLYFVRGGASEAKIAGGLTFPSGNVIRWQSSSTIDAGSDDTYIYRLSAGVVSIGIGGNSSGGSIAYSKSILGGAEAAATTATTITKLVSSIADNTATTILTITVPNGAHAGVVKLTALGRIGAGGSIGADESVESVSYDIAVCRVAGVNAAADISTIYGDADPVVAGGSNDVVTVTVAAVSGAVGATNTFAVQVTIATPGNSADNHTCTLMATLLNANASGITIS